MDNNSEEEKQNYLRENILDKGFDAEDFVLFLTQKKGDEGVDLKNWSLNELKFLVQEYISVHSKITDFQNFNNNPIPPQTETNLQQNITTQNQFIGQTPIINTNQNMTENINLNLNNNSNLNNYNMGLNIGLNNNINMGLPMNMNMNMNNNLINNDMNNNFNNNDIIQNNNTITNYAVFSPDNNAQEVSNEPTDTYGITNIDTISCQINENSELSKFDNIRIEMSLGEKIPGSFFTKAYMTFIISTTPLNFQVRRRYSDFEWLRQTLQNYFSSSVIPPLPKKNKIGPDRFEETFLMKRKRYLEKFLNSLLYDPIIRNSQILYDFLSIEDNIKFIEKKNFYTIFRLRNNLNDFKSPTGKLDVTLNEDNEISYENIKSNTEINHELLTKFNKNLKQLNNEINSVVNRLDQISQVCEELFLNSVKYDDFDNIKISYYQLKDMFKDWSIGLKKHTDLINLNLREYFKFKKNTFRSIKELINTADNYKINYYKLKKNLITKKEDLFKKSDVSKWELGPYKNVNLVTLLKDKNFALPKMLFNETNAVNNIKKIYGYYLNRVITESERIKKLNGFTDRQNISENAKHQITIISELFKNISDIAISSQKYDIKNIEKNANINNNVDKNENENP